jgi:HEAT repeat protein
MAQASTGEGAERVVAIDRLGTLGKVWPRALAILSEGLASEDPVVQVFSARALGDIGPSELQPAERLRDLMTKSHGVRRYEAARALLESGDRGTDIAYALWELCEETGDASTRRDSKKLVESHPWMKERARAELCGDLLSADTTRAVRAMSILHWLRDMPAASVPCLAESLRSEDPGVRMRSATILGRLGSPAAPALWALRRATEDRDADVRTAAAAAMRSIEEDLDR